MNSADKNIKPEDLASAMEAYSEMIRQRNPGLVRSDKDLLNAISAVETWDGEDVGSMREMFRLYEELRETSRHYPLEQRKLAMKFADAVNALGRGMLSTDSAEKLPHPAYAAYSPILQGRNGSILWLNPETNGLLVTDRTSDVTEG